MQPRDAVIVIWEALGELEQAHALRNIIGQYKDHIEGTTKGPIVQRSSKTDLSNVKQRVRN